MTRHYRYDEKLKKVVEYYPSKEMGGVTIIPDTPEFVSQNAFPETVKWTGRRSKKAIMQKYGCVDFRDIKGVGREREKRLKRVRSGMVNTQARSISKEEVQARREQRRGTHFTGYRIEGGR